MVVSVLNVWSKLDTMEKPSSLSINCPDICIIVSVIFDINPIVRPTSKSFNKIKE